MQIYNNFLKTTLHFCLENLVPIAGCVSHLQVWCGYLREDSRRTEQAPCLSNLFMTPCKGLLKLLSQHLVGGSLLILNSPR